MRRNLKTTPRLELASEPSEASLGSIGRALWQKRRSIIIPTLLMTSLAIIAANLLSPKYQSESRVLVEGRENIFLRAEAEKATTDRPTVDQETLTSQVQLVLSRDLARDVIQQLNLAKLPEFNAALREFSPLSLLRYTGLVRDPLSMSTEERVLNTYYERMSAYAVDKSRVIVIDFQSHDPELAARAANVVAEKYLSLQQQAKQDQARAASQWLSGEIEKLRQRVAEAEAKVEEFRARSNLFMGANNTSLSNQQLTELNTQLSAARATKADAENKSRLIRDQLRAGHPIEFSEVNNSELIRRLSEQRVTLRAQLAEQSSTLLPAHPRIKELRAQIADLEAQIRIEGGKLARSFENDAKVAGARVTSLSTNLDQLKRQATSTNEQDVQLRALEREAKAQRDLLEAMLAKFREATARDSIAAAPPDARIISRASVSNVPYFPKKVPIILITALATFCLSAAFVVTGTLLEATPHREPWLVDETPVEAEAAPDRMPQERMPQARPPQAEMPHDTVRHDVVHRDVVRHDVAKDFTPRDPEPPVLAQRDLVQQETIQPAIAPAMGLPDFAPPASDSLPPVASPAATPPVATQAPVTSVEPSPISAPAAPGVMTIKELVSTLRHSDEFGRRVAVIGITRKVGTTLTAIALARELSRGARVILIDLAFVSPNLDVISDQVGAPGIADLVRGDASFGDIITRDWESQVHLVAAGKLGADTPAMMESHMLAAAIDAFAQSYDYLVIDAGSQSDIDPAAAARLASHAVVVAGEAGDRTVAGLRDQTLTAGFADVTVMTGSPPPLDHFASGAAVA